MLRGFLILAFSLLLAIGTLAQNEAERLPPYSQVIGNLSPGGLETWEFNAVDGEVVSLIVESTSELDPIISVISETGALLVTQDDYDYPESKDAIVQALTIPFTGTYTVQVSAFGGTGGSYTLTRLRGYAEGADLNGIIGDGTWASTSEDVEIDLADERLTLSLAGIGQEAIAVYEGAARLEDYYAQVSITVINARGGWVVHLTHRQQSADRYYRFSVNDGGFWRYVLRAGDTETVLRSWISHPAIVPGEQTFNLGIMANGAGHDLFYNGSLLGHFVEETLDAGVVGLGIGTAQALDAETEIAFSDLLVTVPFRLPDGADLQPEQVIIADPARMAQALERRQVIPAGGQLALNVPESSSQSIDEGVSRLPLGRGETYTNFVLSTEVTITTNDTGLNGCGLFMRATDAQHYVLAYIDQTGGYAVAERREDTFLPGVFGERAQLGNGEHHLLITAVADRIRYYIDGNLVGELEAGVVAGTVGNAVVNYERNTTICDFQNTWLWTWDG